MPHLMLAPRSARRVAAALVPRPFACALVVVVAVGLLGPGAAALAYNARVSHIDGPAIRGVITGMTDTTVTVQPNADTEETPDGDGDDGFGDTLFPGSSSDETPDEPEGEEPEGEGSEDAEEREPVTLQLDSVEEIEYYQRTDPVQVSESYPLTLYLVSDDVLIGRVSARTEDGFIFDSMSFGRMPIDLDMIARIEVRRNMNRVAWEPSPPGDDLRQDLVAFNPTSGESDLVDVAVGFLDSITPEGAEFADDNGLLDGITPWGELLAVSRWAQPRVQPESFQVICAARNGERFTGAILGVADGAYTLRSYLFQPLSVDPEAPADGADRHAEGLIAVIQERDVVKLTFRHGAFAYLSDLEPVEVLEYPYFGGPDAVPADADAYWWRYRRDLAVDGSALRLLTESGRSVPYVKGLGVHAYSKLSFQINGRYAQFLADIGLDDSAEDQASVVFEVYVDDEEEPRYRSPVMRASAARRSIEVNVGGSLVVHLVVRFADNGDIQDRANWCKARLVRDR